MASSLTVPLLPALALLLTLLVAWGRLALDYGRQTALLSQISATLAKQADGIDKQAEVIAGLRRDRHSAKNDIQRLSLVLGLLLDGQPGAAKAAMSGLGQPLA